MSLRIAVVYEAEADFDMSTELMDRVVIESIDWIDADLLPHQREWISRNPEHVRLTWKAIPRLARALNIKAHGHINGEPLEADAAAARRAIRYLKAIDAEFSAVVLMRDQDDKPERREGLEQACNEDHDGLVILFGLAVIEREAWVLAGFVPQDDEEQSRLNTENQTLGFNPHEQSHLLTAGKDDNAKLSPKRVLKALMGGNPQRERICWMETPLNLLHGRGTDNGLSLYLDVVRTRLAPLFGHIRP